MSEEASAQQPFDVNEGSGQYGLKLPTVGSVSVGPASGQLKALSEQSYANIFEEIFKEQTLGGMGAAVKALNLPPESFAYGKIEYMPDPNASGILPWPGIAPEALGKIVRENVAPQVIIGMRCDDMMRYSNLSREPWKPGWHITARDSGEQTKESMQKDMREAELFLLNSNIESSYAQARKRDAARYLSFKNFLSAGTRDLLTYDGLALWTDMDVSDRIKAYTLLPAANIRLAAAGGYENNKDVFAVGVDQGGKVIAKFTRDQLTFYKRNPRTDIYVSGDLFAAGYGYSEIEIAVRLIQGFQNAIDLNVDVFNRNGIPNAILTITGGSVTQRQLDIFNRLWTNMKRGITKAWAMPVVGLQGDAKFELVDLSSVKGMEGYYEEWMNMLAGLFCAVYRFPHRRLGYRIGGRGKDTEPVKEAASEKIDEDDPGLSPLLGHWENVINDYLISSRWPHLAFGFTGKSPKEDARQYEAKMNSMTFGEQRKINGMPLVSELKDVPEELKQLAQLVDLIPVDPSKTGPFQTMAGQFLKPSPKDQPQPGSMMEHSEDPARSEQHGKLSGVRRDSAAEGNRSQPKRAA